jgi:hypothetical protein
MFNLIKSLNGDCSIFAHTWDINDKFNNEPFNTKQQSIFFEQNYTLYEIEKYDTTAPWNILTTEQYNSMPPSCKNIVPMFYSIFKANELKKQYEKNHGKFDIVIRSRFDSLYETSLPDKEITLLQKFNNLIFCGWSGYDSGAKILRNMFQYEEASAPFVSDNFAFGSSDAMDVYANTYNKLLSFKNYYSGGDNVSGFIPGPEISLGTNLLLERINFLRTTLHYKTLSNWSTDFINFSSYYNIPQTTKINI